MTDHAPDSQAWLAAIESARLGPAQGVPVRRGIDVATNGSELGAAWR